MYSLNTKDIIALLATLNQEQTGNLGQIYKQIKTHVHLLVTSELRLGLRLSNKCI